MAAKITKGAMRLGKPTKIGELWVLVEPLPNRRVFVHIADGRDSFPSVTQRQERFTRPPEKL